MRTIMVRYKTKPDCAEENAQYVRNVFEELGHSQPAGLRYATFRLPDGLSFVHIATIDTADGSNPVLQSPAFKAFTAGIKGRCEEPPVSADLTEVGSYRFHG
jgi:hypothetical protein